MAATLVGVIYSVAQSRVRRVIFPDEDSQLRTEIMNLLPGEALMTYQNNFRTTPAIQLKLLTGNDPVDDHHAAVDINGNIIVQLHADRSIDTYPGGRLILTGGLIPSNATYSFPTKVWTWLVPDQLIPAGTPISPGNSTVTTRDNIIKGNTTTMTVDPITGVQTVNVVPNS